MYKESRAERRGEEVNLGATGCSSAAEAAGRGSGRFVGRDLIHLIFASIFVFVSAI